MARNKNRVGIYQIFRDFMKKCREDHVTAFGAMSAFFMLLSIFPFLLLLLMLTRYAPFSKADVINGIIYAMHFEDRGVLIRLINEIYRKAGASVLTISLLTVLWSSSRGIYALVLGLNSVYDIDENRNYITLRLFSAIYTAVFLILVSGTLVIWVFGKRLYNYLLISHPIIASMVGMILQRRFIVSTIILTIIFLCIYTYIPNLPSRKGRLLKQLPGALFSTFAWLLISQFCSVYINLFTGFSYVYGSLSWVMILLIWLYWCMSVVFYGAELNYYIENRKFYHDMITLLYTREKLIRRADEKRLKERYEREEKGIAEDEDPEGENTEDERKDVGPDSSVLKR